VGPTTYSVSSLDHLLLISSSTLSLFFYDHFVLNFSLLFLEVFSFSGLAFFLFFGGGIFCIFQGESKGVYIYCGNKRW